MKLYTAEEKLAAVEKAISGDTMNRRSFFRACAGAGAAFGLYAGSKIEIKPISEAKPNPPTNIQATQISDKSISSFYYPEEPPLIPGGHPKGSLWFNTHSKNLELSVWDGEKWVKTTNKGVKNVSIGSF